MNEQKHLLIIDDDENTRKTLSLIFKKKGYEVETAGTGRAAIDQAQEKFFNLALLDVRLPDVTGIELLATLKDMHPDMAVIMATAYASLETAIQALNKGASAYITKPLNLNEVLATVEKTLEKQRLVAENKRLYLETRQRTAQLEALRQVGLKITAQLDLDALLYSIVSQAVELLGGTAGRLYLYQQELDALKQAVTVGPTVISIGGILCRGEGLGGKVWETGKALIVKDYQHWEGCVGVYEKSSNAAVVSIPIHWGKEFLGALNVEDAPARIFFSTDVELLNLFATQAAIAIRNARLFQETQQALGERKALYRASKVIGEANSIEEIVSGATEGATSLGLSFCSLALITATDEEGIPLRSDLYGMRIAKDEWVTIPPITDFPIPDRTAARRLLDDPDFVMSYDDTEAPDETISQGVREAMRRAGLRGLVVAGLNPRGHPVGFLGFGNPDPLKNLTEAHRRGIRLYADQVAVAVENRFLFNSLEQEKERMGLLYRLSHHLSETLDVRDVAQRALDDICAVLGSVRGIVLVREPNYDYLQWVAASGRDAKFVAELNRQIHVQIGDGLAGWVAAHRQSVLVDDVSQDTRWVSVPGHDDEVNSVSSVPLISGDGLVGVINIYSDQIGFFNDDHRQLIESAAATVAAAIANAQLFEAEQRRRQEAETLREAALALTAALERDEVIERILAQLQKVVPYDSASVQLFKNDRMEIVGGRGFPNLPDLLGQSFLVGKDNPNSEIVRTRVPLIIKDVPTVYKDFHREPYIQSSARAWMGVPILVGEQLVGMIALDKREPGFYTQEQARLAEAFAAQAAIAIENSRLFYAERKQWELAEALEQAAAAVSSTLDLDQVLDQILEQVERVVAGDAFNIMIMEDQAVRIVRQRGYQRMGLDNPAFGASVPITECPSLQKMLQTGKGTFVPDTVSDPGWVLEEREWRHSYVAVPIQIKELAVGFLNVNSIQPGQFGPDDALRLQAFADHAATAIENAQLYQKLQDHAEQLENRVQERTAQLQAQYAWQEAILNSTTDGIIVTNGQGKIIQANRIAQTWLNQTLSPKDADLLRKAVQDVTERAEERPEIVLELEELDLELKAAPISEPGTEQATAVVAAHDVSHLKAMDRIKTRFVSNVSHELRTPVTTIKLYAALMKRTSPEKWAGYLDTLVQEADRQAQLVENILQISRIDTGHVELKLRAVSLNTLAKVTVDDHQSLAESKNQTLDHQLAEPELMALVDPEQVTQVLNNLVENGIYYTAERGRITVSTRQEKMGGHHWAVVVVQDTGLGIPENEIPHIFERFFRGIEPREMQVSGTGLGLAIVKEIVELHGGQVMVKSKVGVGTTFTVLLPLA